LLRNLVSRSFAAFLSRLSISQSLRAIIVPTLVVASFAFAAYTTREEMLLILTPNVRAIPGCALFFARFHFER
jgi:hypothetical protein